MKMNQKETAPEEFPENPVDRLPTLFSHLTEDNGSIFLSGPTTPQRSHTISGCRLSGWAA
jgi:hypothetical protein